MTSNTTKPTRKPTPAGKGKRLPFAEYQRRQGAALDAFRKACGA